MVIFLVYLSLICWDGQRNFNKFVVMALMSIFFFKCSMIFNFSYTTNWTNFNFTFKNSIQNKIHKFCIFTASLLGSKLMGLNQSKKGFSSPPPKNARLISVQENQINIMMRNMLRIHPRTLLEHVLNQVKKLYTKIWV